MWGVGVGSSSRYVYAVALRLFFLIQDRRRRRRPGPYKVLKGPSRLRKPHECRQPGPGTCACMFVEYVLAAQQFEPENNRGRQRVGASSRAYQAPTMIMERERVPGTCFLGGEGSPQRAGLGRQTRRASLKNPRRSSVHAVQAHALGTSAQLGQYVATKPLLANPFCLRSLAFTRLHPRGQLL